MPDTRIPPHLAPEMGVTFPTRFTTREEQIAYAGYDDRDGDVVLLAAGDESDRAALADALERNGFCDAAHVVPDGVYLEE